MGVMLGFGERCGPTNMIPSRDWSRAVRKRDSDMLDTKGVYSGYDWSYSIHFFLIRCVQKGLGQDSYTWTEGNECLRSPLSRGRCLDIVVLLDLISEKQGRTSKNQRSLKSPAIRISRG